MSNCDFKIATSIMEDACNPVKKGLKKLGYIANFEDITFTRESGTNKYSGFTLKTGANLYQIYQSGKSPFTGKTSELQAGDYRNTWNKTVPFVILNSGEDVSHNIIDKLANGKFVVILENNFAGTSNDNLFEVVGSETGLCASEGNNEAYNESYGGGWSMTLVEENAPSSALYLLDTDEATTRADIEAALESDDNND